MYTYYLAYKQRVEVSEDTIYTVYLDPQTGQEIYRYSNIMDGTAQVKVNATHFGMQGFPDIDYNDN
jgi:hypothetical protein